MLVAAVCLAVAWLPAAAARADSCTNVGPVKSCPTPSPSPTPTHSSTPQAQPSSNGTGSSNAQADTVDLERQFFELVNRERTSRGMRALAYNAKLTGVARDHSADMASSGHLYHNTSYLQSQAFYREMGYPTMVGENVGDGPSVKWLHDAFMNSSEHRSNILEPRYTSMGIGVSVRDNTIWVTEDFIRGGTAVRGGFPHYVRPIRPASVPQAAPVSRVIRPIAPAPAVKGAGAIVPEVSALKLPPIPAPLDDPEGSPRKKPLLPLAVLATLSAVAFASRRDAGAWI